MDLLSLQLGRDHQAELPLPGQDEMGDPFESAGIVDHHRIKTQGMDRIMNAAEVPPAEIHQTDFHSDSLVLGMPFTRGSFSHAARSALASPLKIASAM